jgi:hypothetical protein
MDANNEITNKFSQQINKEITITAVLNSLFYLATILVIAYYLWYWWQNTRRIKQGFQESQKYKEGFTSADETNSLALEKPAATQAKIKCPQTIIPSQFRAEGIWDGAEDGHILFEEPTRKWTDTRLGQTRYSPGINQALEELKNIYSNQITAINKEMLTPLQQLGLENYIPVIADLDKLVSANSQIAQLKGLSQAQLELLPQLSNLINEIINKPSTPSQTFLEEELSMTSGDELGRQIIRNRQMREFLEKQIETGQIKLPIQSANTSNILAYLDNQQIANELINIANTQQKAYKQLMPLLDEVISKRAKYETEKQEIFELLDILPTQTDTQMASSGYNNNTTTDVQNGGRGQIPEDVLGSETRSPTSERWPQRYYLNKRSGKVYQTTRTLDELRTLINNQPGGLSLEEYQAKYNWIDNVGKDILPVPDDPEIKYALPAGLGRTIPDILSDFDHYNAGCQRIYQECSTRAKTPGFALPNWDTADYYDYLDRLPDAKLAAAGILPSTDRIEL